MTTQISDILNDETNNIPIITLCGSIRFKEEFEKLKNYFESRGWLVLTPIYFDESLTKKIKFPEIKEKLLNIHKTKIDACDLVYIVNKYGYVGSDTLKEIGYAKTINKPIRYLEPISPYINNKE